MKDHFNTAIPNQGEPSVPHGISIDHLIGDELYKFFLGSEFLCTKDLASGWGKTLYKFFLRSDFFCTAAESDLYKIFLGKIKICTC